MATDTLFQASEYIFPLGQREVVQGWDDGLLLFNEGGKGTLYIPAYLAYGKDKDLVEKKWNHLCLTSRSKCQRYTGASPG
jgi:hypothetical protein